MSFCNNSIPRLYPGGLDISGYFRDADINSHLLLAEGCGPGACISHGCSTKLRGFQGKLILEHPNTWELQQPPPTHPTAPELARPETLDCLDKPEKRLPTTLVASSLPITSNSQCLSFPIGSLGMFPCCRRFTQNMPEECNISSPHTR